MRLPRSSALLPLRATHPNIQQALKAGSPRPATGRTTRAGPLSNRALRVAWKAGRLRAAKVFRALC